MLSSYSAGAAEKCSCTTSHFVPFFVQINVQRSSIVSLFPFLYSICVCTVAVPQAKLPTRWTAASSFTVHFADCSPRMIFRIVSE
jgi:hypothetical protein